MIHRFNNQKGFAALLLAILILAVVFSMGISIFMLSYGEQRIIKNAVKSSQAYYSAESGIEDALLRLAKQLNWSSPYQLSIGGSWATTTISSIIGGSRNITSEGSFSGNVRKVRAVYQVSAKNVSFYYGAQVGNGGIEMEDLSSISGNVFSNGSIIAESGTEITGTPQVSGVGNKINEATIGGNAYANICQNSDISGILYAASQTGCTFGSFVLTASPPPAIPLPVSAQDITDWKNEAVVGGALSGNQSFSGGSNPLGPVKIVGDLTIQNDAEIIISGIVWVTGNITVKNNAIVRISSSYGPSSGIIIADGAISLENNSISSGSGQSGSYLMYLSASTANPALTIKNNAEADILYTTQGWIQVENNTVLREITGYGIHLKNNAEITYEAGLQNTSFSSGPGGSWAVVSWAEVE